MAIDKIMDPMAAAKAYSSQLKEGIGRASGDDDKGGEDGGVSFASILKKQASDSIDTLKAGERMSAKAVTNEATITDVVQAVSEAEMTLQTVVAVRDRMISAYQEIMRMPI